MAGNTPYTYFTDKPSKWPGRNTVGVFFVVHQGKSKRKQPSGGLHCQEGAADCLGAVLRLLREKWHRAVAVWPKSCVQVLLPAVSMRDDNIGPGCSVFLLSSLVSE